jgi:hypothetical protein
VIGSVSAANKFDDGGGLVVGCPASQVIGASLGAAAPVTFSAIRLADAFVLTDDILRPHNTFRCYEILRQKHTT